MMSPASAVRRFNAVHPAPKQITENRRTDLDAAMDLIGTAQMAVVMEKVSHNLHSTPECSPSTIPKQSAMHVGTM